jgi:hypothetical protein
MSGQHRQRIDLDDNSCIDILGFRLNYGRKIRSGLVARREDNIFTLRRIIVLLRLETGAREMW